MAVTPKDSTTGFKMQVHLPYQSLRMLHCLVSNMRQLVCNAMYIITAKTIDTILLSYIRMCVITYNKKTGLPCVVDYTLCGRLYPVLMANIADMCTCLPGANKLTVKPAMNVKDMFEKAMVANRAATAVTTEPASSGDPGVASTSVKRTADPMESSSEPIPKVARGVTFADDGNSKGKGKGKGKGSKGKNKGKNKGKGK